MNGWLELQPKKQLRQHSHFSVVDGHSSRLVYSDERESAIQARSFPMNPTRTAVKMVSNDKPSNLNVSPCRAPRFDPGPGYEAALQRERNRPARYGGTSKTAALGSVEESWGKMTTRQYGMFEVEEDPPSRTPSPCRCESDLKRAKEEALRRARAGTSYDVNGIKTNEEEVEWLLPKRYQPRPPLKKLRADREKRQQREECRTEHKTIHESSPPPSTEKAR